MENDNKSSTHGIQWVTITSLFIYFAMVDLCHDFLKSFFFEIKDLYAHTVTLFFWSEKLGCEYLIFKI